MTQDVLQRDTSGGFDTLLFRCPGCSKDGRRELHQVTIKRDPAYPGPTWDWNGDMVKPTVTPSLLVTWRHPKGYTNENPAPLGWVGEYEEEVCHSFIREGQIQFLSDCSHELAGQTVPLPPWEKT